MRNPNGLLDHSTIRQQRCGHQTFFVGIDSDKCSTLFHDRLVSYAALAPPVLTRDSSRSLEDTWLYDREPVAPYGLKLPRVIQDPTPECRHSGVAIRTRAGATTHTETNDTNLLS